MGKEGETLSRMYDDQRECLISALPTRCYKVRNMGKRDNQFDVRLLTMDYGNMSLIKAWKALMYRNLRKYQGPLVIRSASAWARMT